MGTWSSRSVTLLIAGPLSCILYPLGVLLLVTEMGGDTPKVVGHYINCVSLSFVSRLLSEPLSRTGKILSFFWMTLAPDAPLCLAMCMLGGAVRRVTWLGSSHLSFCHHHYFLNHQASHPDRVWGH